MKTENLFPNGLYALKPFTKGGGVRPCRIAEARPWLQPSIVTSPEADERWQRARKPLPPYTRQGVLVLTARDDVPAEAALELLRATHLPHLSPGDDHARQELADWRAETELPDGLVLTLLPAARLLTTWEQHVKEQLPAAPAVRTAHGMRPAAVQVAYTLAVDLEGWRRLHSLPASWDDEQLQEHVHASFTAPGTPYGAPHLQGIAAVMDPGHASPPAVQPGPAKAGRGATNTKWFKPWRVVVTRPARDGQPEKRSIHADGHDYSARSVAQWAAEHGGTAEVWHVASNEARTRTWQYTLTPADVPQPDEDGVVQW